VSEAFYDCIIPLLWSGWGTIIIAFIWDRQLKKRLPYEQAGFAAMTEQEVNLYASRDSRGLQRIIHLLDRSAKVWNPDGTIYSRLSRMLRLMGKEQTGEEAFAQAFIWGLLGALPILAVPVFTDNWFMVLLYPIFALVILYQECSKIKKDYAKWQQELTRDIPEVIDRLRIGFAAGRDHFSVLQQASQNSGSAMERVLDHLVQDMKILGAKEALRLFSVDYDLPVMGKLASALTIAIESGYLAAEAYFKNIEAELRSLRQESIELITRAKPEKVYQLYLLLFALSVAALMLKGWEIMQQIGALFV
jgi:hypothetical protein